MDTRDSELSIPCSYNFEPTRPASSGAAPPDPMDTDTDDLAEQLNSTQLDGDEGSEYTEYDDYNYDGIGIEVDAGEELVGSGEDILANDKTEQGPAHRRPVPPATGKLTQFRGLCPLLNLVWLANLLDQPKLPEDIYQVAHSRVHQECFDNYGIQWGVQWEIARLVTSYEKFNWSDVPTDVLPELCGPNVERAPSVGSVFFSRNNFPEYAKRERLLRQPLLTSPWGEYDAEEALIRSGDRATSIEEFGGKVQQRVRLTLSENNHNPIFKFTLDPPTKSKSNRFSRFLGSRRLIECYFSKKDARRHKEKIIDFFVKKKLLLNGRLFQAFYGHTSGGKIALMEINESFERDPQHTQSEGDSNRISLAEFIRWHNNIHLNSNQTINKWVSRFALGFSTSQPGLVFQPQNMHFGDFDDIYAPGKVRKTAGAHQIMTDGCGFMNYSALLAVQSNMAWETFPTCIQARIAGSKGLFLLHPEHRDPSEDPQIWMRPSQVKIQLNPDKTKWSPVHYVLDVLSGSFLQPTSAITYEMILSLSENGVPDHVLVSLLRDTIQEDAKSLEPSSKPHGSHILWDSVYSTQRVLQSRLRSLISPDAQRKHGFIEMDEEEEDVGEVAWESEPDPVSGNPASAQEKVLGWLQAGFAPTDPFVMDKLVYLQKKVMDAAVNKYRIVVPKSVRAFIVPDPLGVLAENEIFFSSSQPTQFNDSGPPTYCMTGAVLVSRNPCIQKSDTRKVMARNNHELLSRGYYDVIVFSTKGSRSLASLLSGGDYDGDTVVMIWDKDIVDNFTNASIEFADPDPAFERTNFNKSKMMLRDLNARAELGHLNILPDLVRALLQNICPNQLGIYNMFYRNATYVHGLDSPITARLGHMFTQCLDSVKSGLSVKDDVFKRDKAKWDKAPPPCFPSKTDDDEAKGSKVPLERRKVDYSFILDVLQRVAAEQVHEYKTKFGKLRDRATKRYHLDPALIQPLKEAEERVRAHGAFAKELKAIKDHVDRYKTEFTAAQGNQGSFSASERHGKKGSKSTKLTLGERQESIRAISEAYTRTLPTGLVLFDEAAVKRVAASYAYRIDFNRKSRDYVFCFAVAWAEICALKARAGGGAFVSSVAGFMEGMAVHRKMVKVFRELDEGEDENNVEDE